MKKNLIKERLKPFSDTNLLRKIKLIVFFIAIVVCHISATMSYAQKMEITLKLNNVTLRKALKSIEEQTEFVFFYNNDKIDLSRKVSIDVEKGTITDILEQISDGYTYRIENKQILLMSIINQDSKRISGLVIDESGEPIIGANIIEKGTTNGMSTDIDGNFSLTVSENAILQISYIGYISQEIRIGSQTNINIRLVEDSQTLAEVIVIGYGTAKRKDFTGSVSSVRIENSPAGLAANFNALESLKGSVAGLDIGAITSAGGTPSMQVRGQNSISGSNNPLIVVDGVIFMGSIIEINPNDIASYDILKDATSAAAYGSRSANGVIIITTKKGKTGKPVIHFNAQGSMQTWHLKPELMDGEKWLDAVAAANGYSDYSFLTPQEEINLNAGKQLRWLDEISRTGLTQDYQAAISGAGEKMNYYMSVSYADNEGVIKGDDFNRISALGKITTDITSWLQIGVDAAYTRSDFSGVNASVGSATLLSPYGMKYRPNGLLEITPDGSRAHGNPLWGINDKSKRENIDYRDNIRTNAFALVKVPWVAGLTYRFNYAGNMNYRKEGNFTHESNYAPNGSYDDDTRYSIATQNGYLSSANGSIRNERTTSYVIDNILNYIQTFGKHSIDLTAVATRDYKKFESQLLNGSDYLANGNTVLGINGLHYASSQRITLNNYKLTNVGYFGRASYSFGDTYYLTGSYRRDGASVFGANNKWGNFGAVGAAWRITNESFMKNAGFLNDVKLKLSWGLNGNQGLDQYTTLSRVANGQSGGIYQAFNNSGKPFYGINQSSIGNANLGWETTEAWNMGFESALLDNRLFIDLDVYFSRTYDQIFNRTIPVMTGFSSMYSSMGEVKNRGFEATIRSVNIRNKDLNWTTGITFWINRNKLIHLYGEDLDGDGKEDDDIGNSLFIGKSVKSIFGYKQDGIVQVGDKDYMEKNGVVAGTPKYVDLNGDGVINAADRSVIGNELPSSKLNLSNTVQYKNWELYVMISGVFGGNGYFEKQNRNVFITSGDRAQFASNGLYVPYWTEANPNNKYPGAFFTGDNYFLGLQSRAYVRLQDVTLSYTFNQPWVKNAGINNFKLFLTGKNLATITNWEGGDPETGSTALSGSMPVMTNISLGLNFSF
jgi:TonB-linked SusC/RagA family outer membrane protein